MLIIVPFANPQGFSNTKATETINGKDYNVYEDFPSPNSTNCLNTASARL